MATTDTLFELLPHGSVPTTTAFATLDTLSDSSTVVGVMPVLDFPGTTPDSHAEWVMMMPSHYDGGGLTFEINYATDGTDADAVQFEVRAIQMVAADTITSQDLQAQTATDITDTPSTTANVLDVTPTGAISHANAGSPALGDYVRIRLSRDYDHAANTDDAQVLSVLVTET